MRRLARLAGRCIVIISDEPTSLTDGYAFVKVMQLERVPIDIQVVVNMANTARDGEKTFGALFRACASFLKISPQLLGIVRRDSKVREAIRCQTSLFTRFPNCHAAADVEQIAARIAKLS